MDSNSDNDHNHVVKTICRTCIYTREHRVNNSCCDNPPMGEYSNWYYNPEHVEKCYWGVYINKCSRFEEDWIKVMRYGKWEIK